MVWNPTVHLFNPFYLVLVLDATSFPCWIFGSAPRSSPTATIFTKYIRVNIGAGHDTDEDADTPVTDTYLQLCLPVFSCQTAARETDNNKLNQVSCDRAPSAASNPFSSCCGSKLYPITWNPVFMSYWVGCKDTPCTAKFKEESPFNVVVFFCRLISFRWKNRVRKGAVKHCLILT